MCVRLCMFTYLYVCYSLMCDLCAYIHNIYYVAIGSRKRHRLSQEDEGVPELKQREALSDQSNFA